MTSLLDAQVERVMSQDFGAPLGRMPELEASIRVYAALSNLVTAERVEGLQVNELDDVDRAYNAAYNAALHLVLALLRGQG